MSRSETNVTHLPPSARMAVVVFRSRYPRDQRETPTRRGAVRSMVTMMVIAALATPAYAQLSPGGGSPGSGAPSGAKPSLTLGGEKKAKTEEDLEYERQREGAYKAGLSKIPDK